MTPDAPAAARAGSCRACPVSCERVVYPAECVRSECSRLYSLARDGVTFVGCLEGVFGVEIDLERLHLLQDGRGGFGALRAERDPLPMCRSEVERTFEHRADGPCVNPDFLLSGPEHEYRVIVNPRSGDPAA
ncbi:MAG: hypothetical protein AB7V42_01015 [Thermoleophilia bacterium]